MSHGEQQFNRQETVMSSPALSHHHHCNAGTEDGEGGGRGRGKGEGGGGGGGKVYAGLG